MSEKNATSSKPGEPAKVQDEAKMGLEMFFRSALAAALTFELDPHNRVEGKDPKRDEEHRAGILKKIEDECEAVSKIGTRAEESRRSFTVASAVMKNAYGRALFYQGRSEQAAKELRGAITLMPDFIDPYLNLADALMKTKSRLDPNWIQEAQDLLAQALLLSPSNQRAHYLLGRLLSNPAIADFAKAKEHLTKAELIPWSFFFRAEILKDQEGNLTEAIQVLDKSIARFPRVDDRYAFYVKWIILFLKQSGAQAQPSPSGSEAIRLLLEKAAVRARKLQQHKFNEKLRKQGEELVKELRDLQTKIRPVRRRDETQPPGDESRDASQGLG